MFQRIIHVQLCTSSKIPFNMVVVHCTLLYLQHLVQEDARVRRKIPELFEPMMVLHLERVDNMISPGLTILRWTSLNLEAFVNSVSSCLKSLELLIDRANDVWKIQINGNLEAIRSTLLCELPESDPWTPEQFTAKTQVINSNFLSDLSECE